MTDTRATFASLRELTAARDLLPMDWGRWNALFGVISDTDSLEDLEARALAATLGACTRPGMTDAQARTVGDLCAMLAEAEAEAEALGEDPEELLVKARELEGFGLGVLHTTTTHALQ